MEHLRLLTWPLSQFGRSQNNTTAFYIWDRSIVLLWVLMGHVRVTEKLNYQERKKGPTISREAKCQNYVLNADKVELCHLCVSLPTPKRILFTRTLWFWF